MSATKSDSLLLNFRRDTQNSINRKKLKAMAVQLGFSTETQVIHYALLKLANEILPAYEADNGDLTEAQMKLIRNAVPQNHKSVKSLLF